MAGPIGSLYFGQYSPPLEVQASTEFQVVVECDLNNDGDYSDGYEELTPYLFEVETYRGRDDSSQLIGKGAPGRFAGLLDSRDALFSRFDVDSPLYDKLFAGRKLRVRTRNPYHLICTDYLDSPPQPETRGGVKQARLTARGPLSRLAGKTANVKASAGALIGDHVHEVLNDAGWPGSTVEYIGGNSGSGSNGIDSYWMVFRAGADGGEVGDLMTLFFLIDRNSTFLAGEDPVARGWTLVSGPHDNVGQLRGYLYKRVIDGSEPASWSGQFAFGTLQRVLFSLQIFRAFDPANPIDVSAVAVTAAGTNHATPSITTSQANDMLLAFYAVRPSPTGANTWTPPTLMTERADQAYGNDMSLGAATVIQAAAGASGAKTAVSTQSGVGLAILFGIRSIDPAGSVYRRIDAGQTTTGRWYINGKNALLALNELMELETGLIAEGEDGAIIFEDSAHRVNLIANGDFETDLTGWTADTSATIERTNERAKFGSHSCKLTATGGTFERMVTSLTGELLVQGTLVSASVWVDTPSNMAGKQLQLLLWETGGAQAAQTTAQALPALREGWNKYSLRGSLLQADRTNVQLYVGNSSGAWANGDYVFVDGIEAGNPKALFSDHAGAAFPYSAIEHQDPQREVFNVIEIPVQAYALQAAADLWKLETDASVPIVPPAGTVLIPGEKPGTRNWIAEYPPKDDVSGVFVDNWTTPVLGTDIVPSDMVGIPRVHAQFTAANSEFLSVADNAGLSAGAEVSFAFIGWFYLASKTGTMRLASKATDAGLQQEWSLHYRDDLDRFEFSVWSDGSSQFNVTANNFGSPATGQWYFMRAWHDAVNNKLGFQVNEVVETLSNYSAGVFDSTSPFRISSRGGSDLFHDGRARSCGFWKRVLTDAEANFLMLFSRLYSELDAAMKTSLISYWELDEASGQRNDSHGTNHLTDNNTVTSGDDGKTESDYLQVATIPRSNRLEIIVTNTHPTLQITLATVKARGQKRTMNDTAVVKAENVESQTKHGRRTHRLTAPYLPDSQTASTKAYKILDRHKEEHPTLTIVLPARRSSAMLAQVLSLNLSDRIAVEADENAGLGINGDFFIEGIGHRFRPGLFMETVFELSEVRST